MTSQRSRRVRSTPLLACVRGPRDGQARALRSANLTAADAVDRERRAWRLARRRSSLTLLNPTSRHRPPISNLMEISAALALVLILVVASLQCAYAAKSRRKKCCRSANGSGARSRSTNPLDVQSRGNARLRRSVDARRRYHDAWGAPPRPTTTGAVAATADRNPSIHGHQARFRLGATRPGGNMACLAGANSFARRRYLPPTVRHGSASRRCLADLGLLRESY